MNTSRNATTGSPHDGASGVAVAPTALSVQGIAKHYDTAGVRNHAVKDIGFDLREGEFVSIVGPSGCGKTTLIGCISGLLEPSAGEVHAFGEKVAGGPPERMSVVFQDYSRSLFPWLTVERNIGLPLESAGVSRSEIAQSVRTMVDSVELADSVLTKYPWQLSGGMQQRVAIARSLISRPGILLMDEPFASVDAQTRMSLEDLVLKFWAEWRKSILFITHDIDEAVYLSDRIVVLSKSPSTVQEVVDVPLPRPRDQVSTKHDPAFAELRTEVLKMILGDRAGAPGVAV
jgi:NitT/TauT family transport system ATP-binding protein